MRHAYLFEEGVWQANGTYTNEAGEILAVTGESIVTHGKESWRIEGTLRLGADPEVNFRNDYQIVPFPAASDATTWHSDNPAIGRLKGRFALVGEAILSAYRSEDGLYQGMESLRRTGPESYEGFGALFRGDTRVSSWSVELQRRR